MKLIRFVGRRLRGYLDLDVNFRESVTFLIGINGSGKTTVLRLISALLAPSYKELLSIDFSTILLECQYKNDSGGFQIFCEKGDENLRLVFRDKEGNEIEGKIPLLRELLLREYDERERVTHFSEMFNELSVVKKIQKIKEPLFLGLNRRVEDRDFGLSRFERERFLSQKVSIRMGVDKDLVQAALSDIQGLVFEKIREIAKSQSFFSNEFQKALLKGSFKFNQTISGSHSEYQQELANLSEKKRILEEMIANLELTELSEELSTLFSELEGILKQLVNLSPGGESAKDTEYVDAFVKWLLNKSLLERVDTIISQWKDYDEKIRKLKSPINRFSSSLNVFFRESGKEVLVDGKGELKVKISKENRSHINTIFELSSGEKQLVIMFAYLVFYKKYNKAPVVIIDEPELSLHISWQEIFVDALMRASPETQFIMATHAPAILATPERREWCEDLSPKLC